MILRWHYYRNIVTSLEITTRAWEKGVTFFEARKALSAETPRRLQFSVDQGQTWHDVPTVCEPHPSSI